jgi:hypothetical protein
MPHVLPEPLRGSLVRARITAARNIYGVLVLTFVAWLAGFAGLLAIAKQVHHDIPAPLAAKLPLLKSSPDLIFGGESRTFYQVDPDLAARLLGKPPGSAVNIAYDAGEPLALEAVMRWAPDRFAGADVVVSVAPFLFNEGVRSAAVYPVDVAARIGVAEQLRSFLPLRIGTLIRFIRDSFDARIAADQDIAEHGVVPQAFGLTRISRIEPEDRWPAKLGAHPHYANWDLSGPKARFEIGALCDMVRLTHKLTVVVPPWAPGYDRAGDSVWRERDVQYDALITEAGRRCGFDVIDIPLIPGLQRADFADEMHVKTSSVPVYTRYLISRMRH